MAQISGTLKVYTAVIMVVLLIAAISEQRYHDIRMRLFIWILILDIIMLLSEAQVDHYMELWDVAKLPLMRFPQLL